MSELSPIIIPLSLNLFSQLCVVMIFLVTVIIYRSIVSVMMFETGSSVLRTQVGTPSIYIKLKFEITCQYCTISLISSAPAVALEL